MQITITTPYLPYSAHECDIQRDGSTLHFKCSTCAHYRIYDIETEQFEQIETGDITAVHIYPAFVAPGLDVDGGNQIN